MTALADGPGMWWWTDHPQGRLLKAKPLPVRTFEFADGSAAGVGACVAAHVRVFDRAAAGTRGGRSG
jgi:hypothetical protein